MNKISPRGSARNWWRESPPLNHRVPMDEPQADQLDPDRFYFRGLHPGVFLGTASDRYGGWIGQIYSEDRYRGRIERRSRRIGGEILVSEVLPVASVREYFRHFPVLELDFTFYGPLLDRTGQPTKTHQTLAAYARYLGADDRVWLKAPQAVFARRPWRGGRYPDNPDYLDAELFSRGFHAPAVELLGPALQGFIFEQEYQKAAERVAASRMADDLAEFFRRLPADERYHVELRTESLLAEPVFAVLARHRVGLVFSHWTWLPSLRRQLHRTGGRFWSGAGDTVVRLLTPPQMRYQDAFKMAHPFNRLRPDMLAPDLIADTVALAEAAVATGQRVHIMVNNRAAGNAPILARRLAAAWIARQREAERAAHG